jgi:predicted translin family RNA/ssDNA-binding protein
LKVCKVYKVESNNVFLLLIFYLKIKVYFMSTINKKFVDKLKNEYMEGEGERRQIISLSNVALHESKRAIFALHRKETDKAMEKLNEVEQILQKLEKKFGFSRINEEGSYKAAVEEYAEAKFFSFIVKGNKIDTIKEVKLEADSYLGGLCDTTGEMIRLAINEAASGHPEEVEKIKNMINEIMSELVEFDMTGYLRTKYDQAKGNLRKIEQIDYEIKIRR